MTWMKHSRKPTLQRVKKGKYLFLLRAFKLHYQCLSIRFYYQ
uniref:Uncharacterized protein n=1 Tax=Anguilla anguilla TaxID=7936 RepID=A0A0E9QZ58_ANGAN